MCWSTLEHLKPLSIRSVCTYRRVSRKASKGISGYRQRRRFDFVRNPLTNRLVDLEGALFWISPNGSPLVDLSSCEPLGSSCESASLRLSATHLSKFITTTIFHCVSLLPNFVYIFEANQLIETRWKILSDERSPPVWNETDRFDTRRFGEAAVTLNIVLHREEHNSSAKFALQAYGAKAERIYWRATIGGREYLERVPMR